MGARLTSVILNSLLAIFFSQRIINIQYILKCKKYLYVLSHFLTMSINHYATYFSVKYTMGKLEILVLMLLL